jgi:hypothetical protein
MVKHLHKAKRVKDDEFYTKYEDIDAELRLYDVSVFSGKVVYLPFDSCFHSNFFLWFLHNFNRLGIKKLITTNYDISFSKCNLFDNSIRDEAYYCEITNVPDGALTIDEVKDLEGNYIRKLKNDNYEMAGDFKSPFCQRVLKGADIVVSNPPFSLLKEIVPRISDKKFILLIPNVGVLHSCIFDMIKEKKLFLSDCLKLSFLNSSKNVICIWINNIKQVHKRKQFQLIKSVKELVKYDNYDAYNCDSIYDIPFDYSGIIGVPIGFLYSKKIDLKLFDILDFKVDCKINSRIAFTRVFIKLKKQEYDKRRIQKSIH